MKFINNTLSSFRIPKKWNMSIIILGISAHVLLLAAFSDSYMTALSQSIHGITSIIDKSGSSIKSIYDWCFKYTGWFLFPLAACIVYSAHVLWIFWLAELKCRPFSKSECIRRYSQAKYIGVEQAGLLGIAGTLIYVIAGLGLMAEAMQTLSEAVSTSSGGNMLELLPFDKMAKAAIMIVPALGTTLAALVSEGLVNHVGRIIQKWYAVEVTVIKKKVPNKVRQQATAPNNRVVLEAQNEA